MKTLLLSLLLFGSSLHSSLASGSVGENLGFGDEAASSSLPSGLVMLDVSRHFMPLSFLYRQVDELARYGIPALHLHLTDAAGWRMEIKRYPVLAEQAAWRTAQRWEIWWNDGQRRYANKQTDANEWWYMRVHWLTMSELQLWGLQ